MNRVLYTVALDRLSNGRRSQASSPGKVPAQKDRRRERVLSLLTGHQPREESVEAGRQSQSPIEGYMVCSMVSLERAMGAIGWVSVLCLCEELG